MFEGLVCWRRPGALLAAGRCRCWSRGEMPAWGAAAQGRVSPRTESTWQGVHTRKLRDEEGNP